MNFPRITIVTPSFNQAPFLEKTIQSVLNQNYPNLEYIVIDGGSTDGSIEIIKKYEKHLYYWESQKDEGQYHAIQKGFEKSTGDLMAWINSDDLYHPQSLFTVAEIVTSFPEVKWLTGNVCFIDEADRVVRSYNSRRWSKYNVLKGEYVWIQQESTFWKRSLWEQSGKHLNLELTYAADFDLWMKFFQHERLYTIETLLGAFRIRKSNQKTLEHMQEYMKEYREIAGKRMPTEEESAVIKKINFIEKYIHKIPVVKRLDYYKRKYFQAYNYAPLITFDRYSYRFVMKKELI